MIHFLTPGMCQEHPVSPVHIQHEVQDLLVARNGGSGDIGHPGGFAHGGQVSGATFFF